MSWFKRKYTPIKPKKRGIPDGLWIRCPDCKEFIFNKRLRENFKVCPKCNYHFRIGAWERIDYLLDKGSFKEYDSQMESNDPLEFKGTKAYKDKLIGDQKATGLKEAVITGEGKIGAYDIAIALTDSNFIMGSMGSVVGEKITRAIEKAIEKKVPFISVSGSGGGARMYEGVLSLMQMAKTSAAVARLSEAGLLYISLMTDPTMGGVTASFASLGDIIIAEPKALIGFAGPRVIEQTIRQKLPPGFQRSEFLLQHGLVDLIVSRKDLVPTITKIFKIFLS